jgi:hypothetical protein
MEKRQNTPFINTKKRKHEFSVSKKGGNKKCSLNFFRFLSLPTTLNMSFPGVVMQDFVEKENFYHRPINFHKII